MSTPPNTEWSAETANDLICVLQPKNRKANHLQFADVYPQIRAALDRKVALNDVLVALRAAGMKIGLAKLKELISLHEIGATPSKARRRVKQVSSNASTATRVSCLAILGAIFSLARPVTHSAAEQDAELPGLAAYPA